MPEIAIVMGSDSDLGVMKKTAGLLDEFGVEYEMRILSAHRQAVELVEYAGGAKDRGIKVIIAGAGLAAALPGMCAALFPLPVIGVPMPTKDLGGRDSLYSIVQMPPGVPVGCMGIGAGANAALYALRILAVSDEELLQKLERYQKEQADKVKAKDNSLQEKGYREYGL